MPIRPEHCYLYPIDWRELSAMIRFKRAKGRCEHCGRPHGAISSIWATAAGMMTNKGTGATVEADAWQRALPEHGPRQLRLVELAGEAVLPVTRVVLAGAHLDHDPGNNRVRNLAALCQRCHLAHDRPQHRRQRWATLFNFQKRTTETPG